MDIVAGAYQARLFSVVTLYTGLLFVVQSICTVRAFKKVLDFIAKKNSKNILWINFILLVIQNFLVPITFWVSSGDIVRYTKLWEQFQVSKMGILHLFICSNKFEFIKASHRLKGKTPRFFIIKNMQNNLYTYTKSNVHILWKQRAKLKSLIENKYYKLQRPTTSNRSYEK